MMWAQHPRLTASQAKRSPSSSQLPCPTGSPPQASHAVHSHAAAGVITELVLQQAQPVLHHFAGRGCPIIKRPVLQEAAAREEPQLEGGVRAGAQASLPMGALTSKEDIGSPPRVTVGAQAPESAPPCKAPPIVSSRKPSQNTLLFLGGSPGSPSPLSSVHAVVLNSPSLSHSGPTDPRGLVHERG